MSRQNVNPDTKFFDTDGFMLTDIDNDESLMLIPCDTAGNFSWTGVTRAPLTRNAMQTSNTSNQYSDLERPWISIPQEDWTGGRGNDIFTKDTTRYRDGKRAQAAFNQVIFNGPLDYYSTGFRKAETNCPGSVQWMKMVPGSKKYIAVQFSPKEAFNANELYIHLRRRGTPTSPLVVELLTGNLNGTVVASHEYTTSEITDTVSEFVKFTFDAPVALTTDNDYYIRIHADSGTSDNYWEIGYKMDYSKNTFYSSNGTDYTTANFEVFYRVAEAQTNYQTKFFTYEQIPFMVRQKVGSTPTLWMNGDICKTTGSTSTTITDSSKSWTVDAYAGARVGLIYRNGSQEYTDTWRTIVSNTANTLTVDEAWDITPSTNCIFVIVDTPLWKEITGHGLTSFVTDVHVIRGVVYFAQGDYVDARKMRWDNGTFEWKTLTGIKACFFQSVRDSTAMMLYRAQNDGIKNKRTVERSRLLDWDIDRELKMFAESEEESEEVDTTIDADSGKVYGIVTDFELPDIDTKQYVLNVTMAQDEKKSGTAVITLQESEDNAAFKDIQSVTVDETGRYYIFAHCEYRYRRLSVQVTGADCSIDSITCTTSEIPHFEDPTFLMDNFGKITRLFEYGAEQYKSLWIVQEGMLSSINKVDVNNSLADTYTLDRINIDELQTTSEMWNGKAITTADVYLLWGWLNGLQRYYNTQIEGKGPDHDEGLPFDRQGRITQIVSYPSNFFISIDAEDGYSCVMQFNQSGWHEIYRAPNKGERIYDMAFQTIYGPRPDRLWLNVGDDVIWLAMPSKILYAIQDQHAEYTHESVLISAWHTAGMTDIEKLWQTLKIMADYLDGKNCWIEADYQTDEEETWHPIQNWYTVSPSQKEDLDPYRSVNGKKLRYRLRLQSTNMYKTPKVNVVVLEAVGRVDIKMSYNFYFRNIKYKRDLNAEFEDIEPLEVQNVLDNWANKLKKLRMNSRWKIFDNKLVYLDAVQTSVLNELSEGYIGQITLNEL